MKTNLNKKNDSSIQNFIFARTKPQELILFFLPPDFLLKTNESQKIKLLIPMGFHVIMRKHLDNSIKNVLFKQQQFYNKLLMDKSKQ